MTDENSLQRKSSLSKETLFLWADIQYLKQQPSITKEDVEDFWDSYFVAKCTLNVSQDSHAELKEVVASGKITKEALHRVDVEIFELINSEDLKDALHNFAIASVYCKRMRKFFIPMPDTVFGRIAPTVDAGDTWKLIYNKAGIQYFRKKKRFASPHFYVTKAIVSIDLPMQKCMEMLDIRFTLKYDDSMKEVNKVEDFGPQTSIYHVLTKNGMGQRDYCFFRAHKLDGEVSLAISTSVDHVGAPEKKGVPRGHVPYFAFMLRPVTETSCEFSELSCITLDGMRVLSLVVSADFLAGVMASRFIKIRDAIYKVNA